MKIQSSTDKYKSKINIKSGPRKLTVINKKDNKINRIKLKGNTINNIKRHLSEQEDQSIAVQAYINTSNKLDAAIDVTKVPVKVVTSVTKAKKAIKAIKDSKSVVCKKVSSPNLKKQPTNKINKKDMLKKGVVKLSKESFKISLSSKNRVVDNLRDKSDGNLGIQAYLNADKNIRCGVDAVKTTKNTIGGTKRAITTSNNVIRGTNNYIKNRIANNKNIKYKNIKKNILKSNKIKTATRKPHVNSILLKNAKKQIAKKHILKSKVSNIAKLAVGSLKKSIKAIIMIKNPVVLIVGGAFIFLFILTNSVSSGMVSILCQNYFLADDEIALKYKDKVELLDNKLREELSELADDDNYDSYKVIYIGDNQKITTNFNEIFALAAVKFEQDLTYSKKEERFIEEIHSKIYNLKISSETYEITRGEEVIIKRRKIITVYSSNMETVMKELNYSDEQKGWTRSLISNFSEQFPQLAVQYGELTQEEINYLIENAPKFPSKQQEKLYNTALSIVGKVKYFWGGKSSPGWNDDWGVRTLVTSPGSDTTGTYRPLGLDCSGYVDWVYKTSGIGNILSKGGTAYQWGQSYPISNEDLQIGDLAFLQMPNSSGINHVGIYVGRDNDGNNLYAHSQWGTGVIINGYKGFKYFRRVVRFE